MSAELAKSVPPCGRRGGLAEPKRSVVDPLGAQTNVSSKKLENHTAMVAHVWAIEEVVALLDNRAAVE